MVSDEDMTSVLSRQYGVPSIDLSRFDIDPSVLRLVPARQPRSTSSSRSAAPVRR